MSERAAGNPKYIETMLRELEKSGKLQLELDDLHGGGMIVSPVSIEELRAVPAPAKMKATVLQQFDTLEAELQRVLKLVSPLQAFSEGMLVDVGLPRSVFKRLAQIFAHATDEGILEPVTPPPREVLAADPSAKQAWRWLLQLMREEVLSSLLHSERQMVERQVEVMRSYNVKREALLRSGSSMRQSGRVGISNSSGRAAFSPAPGRAAIGRGTFNEASQRSLPGVGVVDEEPISDGEEAAPVDEVVLLSKQLEVERHKADEAKALLAQWQRYAADGANGTPPASPGTELADLKAERARCETLERSLAAERTRAAALENELHKMRGANGGAIGGGKPAAEPLQDAPANGGKSSSMCTIS